MKSADLAQVEGTEEEGISAAPQAPGTARLPEGQSLCSKGAREPRSDCREQSSEVLRWLQISLLHHSPHSQKPGVSFSRDLVN